MLGAVAFTSDHVIVIVKVRDWCVVAADRARAAGEQTRNGYAADHAAGNRSQPHRLVVVCQLGGRAAGAAGQALGVGVGGGDYRFVVSLGGVRLARMRSAMSAASVTAVVRVSAVRAERRLSTWRAAMPSMPIESTTSATSDSTSEKPPTDAASDELA